METNAPRVATAVTTVRVRQGEEGAFAGWLTGLNRAVATFPGYISAVVIPPVPPLQADWVLVQRFQALEHLGAWLDSDARRSLLAGSTSLLEDEGTTNVIEGTSTDSSPQDMVTEIITVSVKPGKEEAYREWVDRIREMEARFPGYKGLQLQPPIPGLQDDWVSLYDLQTGRSHCSLDACLVIPGYTGVAIPCVYARLSTRGRSPAPAGGSNGSEVNISSSETAGGSGEKLRTFVPITVLRPASGELRRHGTRPLCPARFR